MVSMSKWLLLLNTFVYAVRIVFLVMLKFEMRSFEHHILKFIYIHNRLLLIESLLIDMIMTAHL